MRYVRSRHVNSCAIAALAMLTGLSYDKVFKTTHPRRKSGKSISGTNKDTVLKCLEKWNIKYRARLNRTSLKKLKHNAYVSIMGRNSGDRHAIVWDAHNQRILDPDYHTVKPNTIRYADKHLNFIIEILE